MKRRDFLKRTSAAASALGAPLGTLDAARDTSSPDTAASQKLQERQGMPKDYKKGPFKRLVILGESTVQGGPWLHSQDERYPDILVRLINTCQKDPIEYYNKGIGNNAISPRSPGYAQSAKPSAMERYHTDVIELNPDLFILAYGLNDMRANMPLEDFRDDMAKIINDVQKACSPITVLTTVYYMTGYKSYPPLNQGSIELTHRYNECIRGLAAEFDCILADVWGSEGLANWLIHYDGVHANKVGELLLGNRVFEAIAQHASGLTDLTLAEERDSSWTQKVLKMRASVGNPFEKNW